MERFKFDLQRFVSVVTLPAGDNRYENKTSEVRISAANGNDSISNTAASTVTINSGAGNDSVWISSSTDVEVYLGEGEDFIQNNNSSNVTIDGGAGADTLRNGDYLRDGGSNVSMSGGAGNDSIINGDEVNHAVGYVKNNVTGVTLDGGAGDDTLISHGGTEILFLGGEGNDSIISYQSNNTLDGGAGDDTLENGNGVATNVTFRYSGGNDVITGFNKTSTLQFMTGTVNRKVILQGNNIIFTVDDNTVTLVNATNSNEIRNFNVKEWNIIDANGNKLDLDFVVEGTDDADELYSNVSNVLINGGGGNDTLSNTQGNSNVTLAGGAGDDSINNQNVGSDDFESNTFIYGGEGNDTIFNRVSNTTIYGGDGDDAVENFRSSNSLIDGGLGNDGIHHYQGTNNTINVGDGNDWIVANSDTSSNILNGGTGDDYIQNGGSNSTINGGEGSDTISNSGSNVIVNGGAGDDSINASYATNSTITAGAGNDTITLASGAKNNLIVYNAGDGSDTIYGFNADDTLQIFGGTVDSVTTDGKNIFLAIGQNTITFANSYGAETLNVVDANGNQFTDQNGNPVGVDIDIVMVGTEDKDNLTNRLPDATIKALGGNDYITNYSAVVSISGGADDDTIINGDEQSYTGLGGDSITINGDDGNDRVKNFGSYVTVDGGAGSDTIQNGAAASGYNGGGGHYSSISGGAGDDSIDNGTLYKTGASNVTLDGGSGNDTIRNYGGKNVFIDGGAGNDSIYTNEYSASVTIDGGEGDDTIESKGSNVVFKYSGEGNDLITGFNKTSTLQIDSGTVGRKVSIVGGNLLLSVDENILTLKNAASVGGWNIVDQNGQQLELDFVRDGSDEDNSFGTDAEGVKVNTYGGNDTIYVSYSSVTVDGGAGNDRISVSGYNGHTVSNALIYGGADNDFISLNSYTSDNTLDAGDGDDTIVNDYAPSNSLVGGAGNDYISNDSGASVTIDAGSGNDSIDNRSSNVTIRGGAGDDSITNSGSNVSIDGGSDSDTITNSYSNVTINGGEGSDYIWNNSGGTKSFIYGGAGDDSIYNSGLNVVIDGGAGNDLISVNSYAGNMTISGGEGDDTINSQGSNNLIVYNAGDGNDFITGFNATSTLQIMSGTIDNARSNGTDVFLTVGENVITLKNAFALDTLNITDKNGDSLAIDIPLSGTEGNDTISNTSRSGVLISGGAGDDSIYNSGANVTIDGGAGSDTINNSGANTSISGGDDNDTISNYRDNVTVEGGKGDDSIYNSSSASVSISGGEDDDIITNISSNVTIDGGTGDDSISNSGASVSINGGDGSDTIINTNVNVTIDGGAGSDSISNDWHNNVSLSGGAGDDSISNSGSNVTINGGASNDYISNSGSRTLFQYTASNGDDTIEGFNASSTLQIGDGTGTYSTQVSGSDVIVTVGEGSILLKNATNFTTLNIAGIDPYHVFGTDGDDTLGNTFDGATINAGNGSDTITNSGANVLFVYKVGDGSDLITGFNETSTLSISGGTYYTQASGEDIIVTAGTGKVTLQGAATLEEVHMEGNYNNPLLIVKTEGNDKINNTLDGATIQALGGNDTINNNAANVSIDAGSGDDYIDNHGNNVLIDGGTGNNFISNYHVDNFSVTALGGNNTIWSNASNNGTIVTGAGNDTLHLSMDNNIHHNVYVDAGDGDNWLYLRAENSTIKTGSGNDEIGEYSSNAIIDAGAGDDTISAGFTAANLTVSGGAGNDYLHTWGGAGKVYVYTSGNDTVEGFNLLVIADPWTSQHSADNYETVIITVEGKGTLTLPNFGNEKLNVVSSLDEANYNYNVFMNSENAKQDNTTVTGTEDDDFVSNEGSNVLINTGGGNDVINNLEGGNNVTVDMGAGDDSVCSWSGQSLSVDGGEGNDTIFAWGGAHNSTLIGGDGDDRIDNSGDNSSIDAGEGNDTINNTAENVTITAGAGNDLVNSGGSNVTIDAGEGSDTVNNWNDNAVNFSMNGGEGNDHLDNHASNSTVLGGAGDDSVYNYGAQQHDVLVDLGAGDDWVDNHASNSTVLGGEGNDFIDSNASNVIIDAGDGNDSIVLYGNNHTVAAGEGADTITNNGCNSASINAGAGNDNINNWNGSDNVIDLGDGNDRIQNNASDNTIAGGAGNDRIYNSGSNVSIDGGEGADTIENSYSSDVTITGGAGDDRINNRGSNVTIDGGAGSDTIDNGGSNSELFGGEGHDYIRDTGNRTTINGGAGNDSIDLVPGNNVIEYNLGDGDDTINVTASPNPHGSPLTINLADGVLGSTSVGANGDILLHVGNNTLTLKNARGERVIVIDAEGNETQITDDREEVTVSADNFTVPDLNRSYTILNEQDDATITAGNQADGVENFGFNVKINSGAGHDAIDNHGSQVTIDGGDGNDYINNNGSDVTINAGAGNDSVYTYGSASAIGGISAIVGGQNIFVNGDAGNDYLNNDNGQFVLLDGGEDSDTIEAWNASDATLLGGDDDDQIRAYDGVNVSIDGGAGDDNIEVNNGINVTASGGDGNDYIWNENPNLVYVYTSGDDTLENFNENSTLVISGGYSVAREDEGTLIINVDGKGSITLNDYWADNINIVSSVDEAPKLNAVYNTVSGSEVYGSDEDDYIKNRSERSTIDAGEGSDIIESEGSDNLIYAGGGSDTVRVNGGNNVTVDGGEGNDFVRNWSESLVYVYSGGNDTIENFNENSTLVIEDDYTIERDEESDSLVVYVDGKGTITLRECWMVADAIRVVASVEDAPRYTVFDNDKPNAYLEGTDSSDRITNMDAGRYATISAGGGSDIIRNYANDVLIEAGSGDDQITNIHDGDGNEDGSFGDGDNVTIDAGEGNDYIHNDGGQFVTFNYTGGDDTIDGFNETSLLELGGMSYRTEWDEDNLIVYVDDGSITLVDVAGLSYFNIGDASFNPHGGRYIDNGEDGVYISGSEFDDTINNYGANVFVDGGAGNDLLLNTDNAGSSEYAGRNSSLFGGNGNDTLMNGTDYSDGGDNVLLDGGSGDDFIGNYNYHDDGAGNSASSTLIGGDGSDTIVSYGAHNVVIDAGAGNDSVSNIDGQFVTFNYTGGNDTIRGFNETSTLSIVGEVSNVSWKSRDLIFDVDGGSITLKDVANVSNFNVVGADVQIPDAPSSGEGKNITNSDDDAYLVGTKGDDSINNYGSNVTIEALGGNDNVNNSGNNVTIDFGAGNDSILSNGNNVTVNGGEGNDMFNMADANNHDIWLIGGEGNDTLWSSASNSTLDGGAGDDTIANKGENVIIDGGDGNDVIATGGNDKNGSVNAGAGNDTIWNGSDNITIRGGAGDDNINSGSSEVNCENVLLDGGSGNDNISNGGNNSTIDGGLGNDTIWNGGDNVTINGGEGDDTIDNANAQTNVIINGDAGNDNIWNGADNVTINGGDGDDTIGTDESSRNVILNGDAGNDEFHAWTNSISLNGGAGNDWFGNAGGQSVYFNGGDDDDYVQSNKRYEWNDETGKRELYSSPDYSTLEGGAGNDRIWNQGDYSVLDGGTGDDNIDNDGDNVTIDGGLGNDYIWSEGLNVSIDGGAGNDTIEVNGANVTASGGEGNNYIRNSSTNLAYVYAGGFDTINHFTANDALVIESGTREIERRNKRTFIVNVAGQGSIVLENCRVEDINIVTSIEEVPTLSVIRNYEGDTIVDGTSDNDSIFSNGDDVSIDAGAGNDTITAGGANVTIDGGTGNDYVSRNSDSAGQIYVYTSGNDTLQNFNHLNTIVLGDVTVNNSVRSGNTITLNLSNGNTLMLQNYPSQKINIVGSLEEVERFNVIESDEENPIVNGTSGKDFIRNWGHSAIVDGGAGDDFIISGGENLSINAGSGDDVVFVDGGINITATGGTGNDYVQNWSEGLAYVYAGGNDTIENFNPASTLVIEDSYDVEVERDDDDDFTGTIVINVAGKGSITLTDCESENVRIVKSVEDVPRITIIDNDEPDAYLEGTDGNDRITNMDAGRYATISAFGGDDTITNFANDVLIEAGSGDDQITNIHDGDGNEDGSFGDGDNVTIDAGEGNDYIHNDGGQFVTFNYTGGDDTIDGFNETSLLELGGMSYRTEWDEDNLIVYVDDGSITLVDVAGLSYFNIGGVSYIGAQDIANEYDDAFITGSDFDDTIYNTGSNVTIDALGGDDQIYNSGDYSIIDAGGGDNEIVNDGGHFVTINAGDGNDTVHSWGGEIWDDGRLLSVINPHGAVIDVGDGNNFVENHGGMSIAIIAGSGDDTITNNIEYERGEEDYDEDVSPDFATISAGKGNDYIRNEGQFVTFNYTGGSDTIEGFNETSMLNLGGMSFFTEWNEDNLIVRVGDGSITLTDVAGLSSLNIAGVSYMGAQDITNEFDDAFVTGSDFDDTITNTGSNVTIEALGGNDTIQNHWGANVSIVGGAGDDSIINLREVENSETGEWEVFGDADHATILGGDGDDNIRSEGSSSIIDGGLGNDYITTDEGLHVSVDAGDGDDIIAHSVQRKWNPETQTYDNVDSFATLNGGAGNDTIWNTIGNSVTINGGDGNDKLYSYSGGENVLLNGGDGNDKLYSYSGGKNVTINGGTGDDYIRNYVKESVTFTYTSGDGNDTIEGFNETSTLVIGDGKGTYSTQEDGDNLIVKVGNGSITLVDAAGLSSLNIDGKEILGRWTVSGTTATYKNGDTVLATVTNLKSGLKANADGEIDGITVDGDTIKLDNKVLNKTAVTLTGNYELELGNDVTETIFNDATWSINKTTATLSHTAKANSYKVSDDGKSIAYWTAGKAETLATITGLKSGLKVSSGKISGITVSDDEITLAKSVLGTTDVTLTGNYNYNLKLGSDVAQNSEATFNWKKPNATTVTYEKSTPTYYALSDDEKSVTYSAAKTEELIKIAGLKSGLTVDATDGVDGIYFDGETVTLHENVLGNANVTFTTTGNYKLALDLAVSEAQAGDPAWSVSATTALLKATTTDGYKLSDDGKTVIYTAAKTGATLAKLTGLKSGLKVEDNAINGINFDADNKTITLTPDALAKSKVKLTSDDYTLALADDVAQDSQVSEDWSVSGTTATYKRTTPAHYELDGDTITYKAAKVETLAKVTGINGKLDKDSDISIDGDVITLSANALNGKKVTVSGDYTLKLGSDVDEPALTDTEWKFNKTTATLTGTTSAGYTLAANEKSITYTKEKTSTLATITGIANGFNGTLAVNDGVITLPEEALGTSTIKVKGDYTLELDNDSLTKPAVVENVWTVKGTTATYKGGTAAYYELGNDNKTIAYKPATTSGNAIVTVTGLKKGLSVGTNGKIDGVDIGTNNQIVTVTADVLGTTNVTVSEGYKLDISDELKPKATEDLTFDNNVATLTQETSEGYTLNEDGNKITYSKAKTVTLATVSGVKSDALDFDADEKIITVNPDALDEQKVTIKGNYGYKLALDELVEGVTVSDEQKVEVNGTTATVSGNASAGYTLSNDGKSINYTKENSATLATITGLKNGCDESLIEVSDVDKTITISADALGTSTVKVKGDYGYTLELDDDYEPVAGELIWTIKGTTATLQEGTTEGYTVSEDGTSIAYSVAKKGATLATLTGLAKDFSGTIDVDADGVITLPADALGKTNITLKGEGYTLALADDVAQDSETADIWTVSGTTATRTSGTTAYYTLEDNTITYNPATTDDDNNPLTLTGLKKNLTVNNDGTIDGITVEGNTIKLKEDVLNKTTVTVSDGYKLELDGVTQAELGDATWAHNNSKAVLKQTTSAGYSCGGESITYSAKDSTKTLAIVSGVKVDLSNENISGDTITLGGNDLNQKVTVSGGYAFNFSDDYSNAVIIGSAESDTLTIAGENVSVNAGKGDDSITVSGTNVSINGGKGDDTLWGNANVETTYLYSNGDGNDVIHSFGEDDLLEIKGTFTAEVDGNNLKFTVGKGSITLEDFTATSLNINGETKQVSELTEK